MLGIVLDYRRTDAAFAVSQWAKGLEEAGLRVSLFSLGPPAHVCDNWDARVARNRSRNYVDWVNDCDQVLFCHPPAPEVLYSANHAKTLLLCLWEHLPLLSPVLMDAMDRIICPSRALHRYLQDDTRCDPKKLVRLSWDLLVPSVRREQPVDEDRIGLLWNLDGSQAEWQDFSFFNVMTLLLAQPNLYFTVFWNDQLSQAARTSLDDLRYKADGRIELLRNPSLDKQIVVAASHDLTLWPSCQENFGWTGLVSIAAGTPCVAYDHPVIAEIVKDGHGGSLVPCELEPNDFGAPVIIPNTDRFCAAVLALTDDPARLQDLRHTSQSRSEQRRKAFVAGQTGLFSL